MAVTPVISPPACPACGQATWSVAFEGLRDRLYSVPGEFVIWRCESCGLLRLWPIPEDLGALYPKYYYSYIGASKRVKGLRPVIAKYVREVQLKLTWRAHSRGRRLPGFVTSFPRLHSLAFRELTEFAPPRVASLLDVGCGAGDFLLGARVLGLKVRGVELSDSAAKAARERGLICDGAGIAGLADIDEQFDVIRLFHVLEHLVDPVEALRAIAGRLSPRGVAIIGVPNVDGVMARVCGPDWYPLEVPRHLWGFGRESLTSMLGHAGLRAIRVDTRSYDSVIYGSLRYLLESRAGMRLPGYPSRQMVSLSTSIGGVSDQAGIGDHLVVVVERDQD
jgi:2-polyprenyl-3-methyl-5-hydroxy-6-metoxy-1,4-benzoquinol methylase